MINRAFLPRVTQSLNRFPIVGIIGSRQVGKTTLAKQIQKNFKKKSVYIDLELPSDLNKLQAPELYLQQHSDKLIVIDEIQRMPELFPLLRTLVDQKKQKGRFLILGSASPNLIKNASESLAGRIHYLELNPLQVNEIQSTPGNIQKLWLRGGYPNSYLAKTDKDSFLWRESFITTHLERDLPQLGVRIPALKLRRFLTMLAHSHGQLLNISKIASGLGFSNPSIHHYLDLFEGSFILRRLTPHYINLKKRLIKSPKVYFRDSGLLHALLGIKNMEELQSHPALGSSWEGFLIQQILSSKPVDWEAHFFRSNAGAEIDLLLSKPGRAPVALEMKYSLSPVLRKDFWNAYKDLECKKGYVIYPGKAEYPLKNGVQVIPVNALDQIFKNL